MTLIYRFNFDEATALQYGKIPLYISIVISPLIGTAVDHFGHNLTFATIGCAFCLTANALLLYDPECTETEIRGEEECTLIPNLAVICWGMSNSIYYVVNHGTIFSALVPEEFLGTAFGIAFSVQALF